MSETASTDTPVLDLLSSMTADSLEATRLDVQSIPWSASPTLVASGALAVSYALNLAVATDTGLDIEVAEAELPAELDDET